MSGSPVIWTVGLRCRPEDEGAFNRWYDEVHVPMLLAGGHVAKVTRYELAAQPKEVAPGAIECPTYQTVYEFDDVDAFESWVTGEDRAAAGLDKSETWAGNPYEVVWAARYDRMPRPPARSNQNGG